MKPKFAQPSGFPSVIRTALCFTCSLVPLTADMITWNNSSANGLWSTPANWDSGLRPVSNDDVIFPTSLGGTIDFNIVGGYTPTAQSIQFNDTYTVGGYFVRVPSQSVEIGVNGGSLVTFGALLNIGALTKSGTGTLILTNANTVSGATVSGGTLRTTSAAGLGGAGGVSILNGSTFEIGPNALMFPAPITMAEGTTLRGLGTVTTQGTLTIDPAATSITFGTTDVSDILQVTDASYELSGGSASTIIHVTGPGTVRPGSRILFSGSWQVHDGLLDIRPANATPGATTSTELGNNPAGSVTFAGGDFQVRSDSGPMNLTNSQGNNVFLNADTTFTSERLSPSFGVIHKVGSTTLGSHTFTILPGTSVNSGEAGFEVTRLTLTGNPVLALPGTASADSKLIIDGIDGGVTPRAITVTGDGYLTFDSSGTNALADGSTVSITGGGNVLLNYPPIGPGPVTPVTMGQNPIGDADLSMTDGTLLLRGSSTGTIFSLPNHLTLGGTITVDPERNVSGSGNVVFRMASITLKPDTVMGVSGDNSFAIGSLGPVVLQGNATLQGFNSGTTADGVTNFYGGISGGPGSALTIGNTLRPINLTISASSTYGGGTVMQGGNVTLNAANGFGTGSTTLNGGNLVLSADAALNGTVSLNGGVLVVNGPNVLAANPVLLNGGTLDLRTNANATAAIPSLTVSGTAAINTTRASSSGSALLTIPVIDVTGNTTLTVTAASFVTSLLSGFDLSGDLTLNSSTATRVTSITEDGSPRKFIKTGTAQLDLEGVSTHSGGTEVLAGTLYVENSAALGSGPVTIGATSGSTAVTARFLANLTIPNNIVVRSGNSGLMTLDAETGRVTWNGNVDLQKSVTLDNGSSTAADLSYFNGVVSGAGDITKISAGEIVLSNAANSFGNGTPTSVAISAGTLTVASNGALGNVSNGVNLTSTGILKISGTFATSRTLTVTGASTDVNVTTSNTFTVNSPIAGTGTFAKGDTGTLAFGPAVDATSRGSSITLLNAGVLRLQGAKNLGNASPLTLSGGTLELLNDSNTNFAYPVTLGASTATIHVDRAAGGSASNGRHTLGGLSATSGDLTVTGANGFGLTLGAYTTTGDSSVINNAPGTLILPTLTGNPATSSRTLTVGGSGNIQVAGATSEGVGTGSYGVVKTGPGSFTFGTTLAEFGRILTVNDGLVDLNGLSYSATGLVTLGGTASALGARINTGGAGSLNLGAGLTFSNTGTPAGAVITGNVGIGTVAQAFNIGNSNIPEALVDLTINGPISGSAGSSITKSGLGRMLMSGAGNTLPGLVSVSGGFLELAKSSGDAIGTGGLATSSTGIVRLAANEQINNNAAVSIGAADESFLELNNFTETVGPLSLTQTDVNDYSAAKTGATGTLVLNGTLTFNNNVNSASNDERNVLITGTGGETTPAFDGFLDLGGVARTIHVTTNVVGANESKANATIETRIINGGIVKIGPRILFLTNPTNTFAGGLQIAGGTVRSGGGSSLGLGPVTFTNTLGVAAGIDFGTLTGTSADNFDLTGTGDATFTYSALAPNTLVLSGDFNTTQNLIFDVVNGSIADGDTATLDLTGTIDDAAATIGLTKVGNGTLKLAPANTYSGGTTIQKGILAITADSALGNTTVPLTIDGGCLQTSLNPVLARNLVFTANGGSIRSLSTFEIPGDVNWGSGTTAVYGNGRTILSGTTTAATGNLQLGTPTSFAATSTAFIALGHTLSLRGTSALPTGNLSISKNAVLELGNGDFTRSLGTGPGQVQLPTENGGGWAAHGANRSVNLGAANLVWGQVSPPFLYRNGPGTADIGQLILGSATATHTVDFQSTLEFPSAASFTIGRDIICLNGAATVDGLVSGDVIQNDPLKIGYLGTTGDGTLEISGDILGRFRFLANGQGTTILSGNNSGLTDGISVFMGSVVIASNSSLGTPANILINDGFLNATAMTVPVSTTALGLIYVDGTLTGNVAVNGGLEGNGDITGNVTVPASSSIYPGFGATLHIGGDLTLSADSLLNFDISGTQPEVGHNRLRVTGAVNLSGNLGTYTSSGLALNDALVLLLNDGSDPIIGTFSGLPEGAVIPIGDSLALQVTYLANGDGGAVGNDFGVTVIQDASPYDIWIDSFTSLTDPADKTKDANPDRDVLNNLGEFALDGDPTTGTSSGKIVGKIAPVGGLNVMTLTIPVRNGTIPDAGDPAGGELVLKNAADGLTYRLQASDNLTSFGLDVTEVTGQDAADIQNGLPPLSLGNGWIYRTFRSPGPVAGDPSEFMRVQIDE